MKKNIRYKSADKKSSIHAVIWMPAGEIKAIVQISHGMQEYIERYNDFAEYLNAAGILVAGNDHIGHGNTVSDNEELGYLGESDGGKIMVEDLHNFTCYLKKTYPGVSLVLLGHSMGSFVARRYMMNYGNEITSAIIMGTENQPRIMVKTGMGIVSLISKVKDPHYRSDLASKLMFGNYNKIIKNPASKNSWLTSDKNVVERYDNEPRCSFVFTVSGLYQIFKTILYVTKRSNIQKIPRNLPILVISGKDDPVGNYGKDVAKVYSELKKAKIDDVSLIIVDNARHEIINEVNKDETYRKLLEWIERVCKQ